MKETAPLTDIKGKMETHVNNSEFRRTELHVVDVVLSHIVDSKHVEV